MSKTSILENLPLGGNVNNKKGNQNAGRGNVNGKKGSPPAVPNG